MGTNFSSTDYTFNGNVSLPANAALGVFSAQSYSTTYGTGGDDTLAIQAALNDAIAAGGAVAFLPPPVSGGLRFSKTLILGTNGASLVGASGGVELTVIPGSNLDWAVSTAVPTSIDYRTVFAVNTRVETYNSVAYNLYDPTNPVFLSYGGSIVNCVFNGDTAQTSGLGLGVMLNGAFSFSFSNVQFYTFPSNEDISLWDCVNTSVFDFAAGGVGPAIGVHRACYDTSIFSALANGSTAPPFRVYAEQFTKASVTTTYSPAFTKFVAGHCSPSTVIAEAFDLQGACFVNLTGCTGDKTTAVIGTASRFGVPCYQVLSDVGAISGVSSITPGPGIAVSGPAATPTVGLAVPVPIADGGTGSTTQNFVDLTSTQTVGGYKTFTSNIIFGPSGGIGTGLAVLAVAPGIGTGFTPASPSLPFTVTNAAVTQANLSIDDVGDITLAVPLQAASGGTGLTAPGTTGNVLTSNGTAWTSAPPSGGGGTILTFASTAKMTASTSGSKVTVTTNGADAIPSGTTYTTVAGDTIVMTGFITPSASGTNFVGFAILTPSGTGYSGSLSSNTIYLHRITANATTGAATVTNIGNLGSVPDPLTTGNAAELRVEFNIISGTYVRLTVTANGTTYSLGDNTGINFLTATATPALIIDLTTGSTGNAAVFAGVQSLRKQNYTLE